MVVIFCASSDRQSFQHSSRIIGPLLHWIFPGITLESEDQIVFICRKVAHALEYAFLGILAWLAIRSLHPQQSPWNRRDLIKALIIVFVYAVSDEIHQSYVPSRQGAAIDVLIDTAGGAAGLFLVSVVRRIFRRDKGRKQTSSPAASAKCLYFCIALLWPNL
jgi:VanZ family protein